MENKTKQDKFYTKIWFWIVIIVTAVIAIAAVLLINLPSDSTGKTNVLSTEQINTNSQDIQNTPTIGQETTFNAITATPYTSHSTPKPEAKPVVTEQPQDNLTMGQKNALKSAKSYLNTMPFSYEGLVNQLEYEGYSNSEAKFAADNCGADWRKQACTAAKHYLSTMPFSRSGLIEQLEYESYSESDAIYAADNSGANWKEQAAKAAKSYLDSMSFSRDGLIGQLEYEGFSHEEAEYGVAAVGY